MDFTDSALEWFYSKYSFGGWLDVPMDKLRELLFEEIKLSDDKYEHPSKLFHVALYGFSENDLESIERIFRLTENRNRQYSVSSLTECEILIVNQDEYGEEDLEGNDAPVVWVADSCSDAQTNCLKRPIKANRLLKILDKITIQKYFFVPEFEIGAKSIYDHPEIIEHVLSSLKFKSDGESVSDQQEGSNSSRVLVVDDSLMVRKQMGLLLFNMGIEADFAKTGNEALEFVSESDYGLILLDIVLPEADGFSVAKAIKKHSKIDVPIVMMSSRDSNMFKLKSNMVGGSYFLTKPFNQQELFDVVSKFIPLVR